MCGFVVVSGTFNDQYHSHIHGPFQKITEKLIHRGPDDHQIKSFKKGLIGFHRLAIMDLSPSGSQPFTSKKQNLLVCNGEIYNYKNLLNECSHHQFISHSDCEVLLPLYEKWGMKGLVDSLDAEFALVIWDEEKQLLLAARDPMGIRPLFFGKTKGEGLMAFSSEAKALIDVCNEIEPVRPGHYYDGKEFKCYLDLSVVENFSADDQGLATTKIHTLLKEAVIKRLQSDAEVGFLLSGGLDSSLVCALAQKHSKKPIRTFSIGMTDDAIDSKYAQDVATYIGAHHTNISMTKADVLSALRKVIWHLETWDITTIRASIGMYLVCKAIKETTNIKVLLTGEVSDELFGYKYTDFAPSPEEFQKEAAKRVRELYLYDVLRADRSISAHSLEARVPFSDKFFVSYVMSLNPKLKMNTTGMGKFLLRESFKAMASEEKLLPDHILWRDKAAFSDAVGHSMVDELKKCAEETYTDADFASKSKKYSYRTPFTKESLLYREIFEEFYPNRAELIIDYWMPNKSWDNCNVTDPSARVLPNYGASGK
jgi:asparagine synthase (glutamine-hydrolysing)